ncbi:MAG: alpha-glucan family phosphorylase [Rhodothermales bacterium]
MSSRSQRVAYFCMEYGLDLRLKTYAGGLGILAGDHLKGAHDHGYPIVGLGLKWKQGYGNQSFNENGKPQTDFRSYTYADDVLEDTGVEVTVSVADEDVHCKVWKTTAFGNVPLYLLDTDLPGNPAPLITDRLYGGSHEDRVAQEIVLGIGGVRALRALGLDIDVYHFNEGHALLAAFELIREKRAAGASYDDALAATRDEIVFTTHTPVLAGNEQHPLDRLMDLGANNGLTRAQLKALGGEPFNMTVGGLRLARKANAVAQLHGVTAQLMWRHVEDGAEIAAITNGVHHPTWVDSEITAAADDADALWAQHQQNKEALLDLVERRTGTRLRADRLLIGFARRAVTYKRPTLIFTEEERIAPLLESGKLQLVFSGKAHPQDAAGQAIVAELAAFSEKYPKGVVFIPDYDMEVGAAMTRGADVWLNNPRRPKEASGTSGMKAAMNGVLNLSTLDGWWPEACDHGANGWQFGDGFESPDEDLLDAHDLEGLYDVLFGEVVPTYYDDRARWVAMMQQSIADTHEPFSVERMLQEYDEQLYTASAPAPAA